MPKGDVTFRFGAETAQFVNAVLQARSALEATAQKTRDFGDSAKASSDKAVQAFAGMASGAISSFGAVTSAAGAAAMAVQIAMTSMEQMKEKGATFTKNTANVDAALAAAGQGGDAAMVHARLKAISQTQMFGQNIDPTNLSAAFKSLKTAAGGRLTSQVSVDAANIVTEAALGGMSDAAGIPSEAALNIGLDYQDLKLKGVAGTDEQLKDMAFNAQKILGRGFNETELSILSRSKDKNKALEIILGSGFQNQRPRALQSIMARVKNDPTKIEALLKNPRGSKDEIADLAAVSQGMTDLAAMAPQTMDQAVQAYLDNADADTKTKIQAQQAAIQAARQASGNQPQAQGVTERQQRLNKANQNAASTGIPWLSSFFNIPETMQHELAQEKDPRDWLGSSVGSGISVVTDWASGVPSQPAASHGGLGAIAAGIYKLLDATKAGHSIMKSIAGAQENVNTDPFLRTSHEGQK